MTTFIQVRYDYDYPFLRLGFTQHKLILTQSLVLVFAHLIVKQRDEVLRFLAGINIDDKSGLEIFVHAWCENYMEFQGYYLLKLKQGVQSLIVVPFSYTIG